MSLLQRSMDGLRRRVVAALELPSAGSLGVEDIFGPRRMALYVHVPFCGSRCAYCVFNKNVGASQLDAYLRAVEGEAALYGAQPNAATTPVHAVYLGGGTPSYLPAEGIERILAALGRHFTLAPDVQITLEANPESVETSKLERYRRAGITRISVGAQSFDERFLRRLGRRHRPAQIQVALERVRAAGIDELSIDLMFGLPGQKLEDLADELRQAIAAPITHISLFAMLYRRGTPLWKQRVRRRPLYATYAHGVETLRRSGFAQYTAEDFTRSGVRCGYQEEVWRPGPKAFIGLGPGALSVFGSAGWYNVGDLEGYAATLASGRLPIAGAGNASTRERSLDHLMSAAKCLRVDPRAFAQRFGRPLGSVIGPLPTLLRGLGLVRRDEDGTLAVTTRGAFYASLLWGDLVLRQLAQAGASRAPAVTGPALVCRDAPAPASASAFAPAAPASRAELTTVG